MPDWRPIEDRHAWSETNRRPTCLIRDPSKTDMPQQRPIRDWHASSETTMPDRRPIGERHAWSETHRTPIFLIRYPWETDMPNRKPIGDQHAWSETHQWATYVFLMGLRSRMLFSDVSHMRHVGLRWGMSVSDQAYGSLMRHVGFRLVSDKACRFPKGLQSGMLVFDEACRSSMGLRWGMSGSDEACQFPMRHFGIRWGMSVSDQACRSPIIITFSWTRWKVCMYKAITGIHIQAKFTFKNGFYAALPV